jgi:glutaredoxin 2
MLIIFPIWLKIFLDDISKPKPESPFAKQWEKIQTKINQNFQDVQQDIDELKNNLETSASVTTASSTATSSPILSEEQIERIKINLEKTSN